jgi:hypothetical protein
MHERNAEGAFGRFAGFVDPDAAYRLGGCRQVHGRDEWQSLRRCEALDTVHPSALLPGIVLGHPAHRESFCAPGCREQLLESAGVPGLSTGRCWIDSSWELEASSLELAPGDRLPCIPMTWVMAHDVCTLLEDSSVEGPVPLWADLSYSRGPWLWGSALPPHACGLV